MCGAALGQDATRVKILRRGTQLVRFLPDIECDLFEPVDRVRDRVDVHEHAPSLHLQSVGAVFPLDVSSDSLNTGRRSKVPDQRELELVLARLVLPDPRALRRFRPCCFIRLGPRRRPRRAHLIPVRLLPRPLKVARESVQAVEHDQEVDLRGEAGLQRGDVR